jgi:hypothetical protein
VLVRPDEQRQQRDEQPQRQQRQEQQQQQQPNEQQQAQPDRQQQQQGQQPPNPDPNQPQPQPQQQNPPPNVQMAYTPDFAMFRDYMKEVPKFDGSKIDEFVHAVEHAMLACGINGNCWVNVDLGNDGNGQGLHDIEVAKGRRVLAIIATRLILPVQSRWRQHYITSNQTVPAGARQALGGAPITWTNTADVTPFGPEVFRTSRGIGNTRYPTLKEWLYATFPVGTAATIVPESVKYHKINWSSASYNGTAEKFIGWVQTVLALKTANRVPDVIPDAFGSAVTEGIAAYFTGVAAEAWLNTPDNQKPRHIGSADPTDNDQTRLIPWVRNRFRSPTHELVKHRELQSVKWDEKMPLNLFNEQFCILLMEAGYGPGRPVAESFKVEWYLNALPVPLAQRVRASIFSNEDQTRTINRLLAAAQRPLLPAYEPTLASAQELAVKHQTDFQLHGRQKATSTTTKKEEQKRSNPSTQTQTQTTTGQRKVTCYRCGKEGHIASRCTNPASGNRHRMCHSCGEPHEEGKHTKPRRDVWCHKCKKVHPNGQCTPPTKAAYGATSPPAETSTPKPDEAPKPTPALAATPPVYFVAHVNGHKARVVVDSGCTVPVVTSRFIKLIGRTMEPSNHVFEQLSGQTVNSLSVVKDIPLDIDSVEFSVTAQVLDTRGYDLLVGWPWITQNRGVIDSVNQEITLRTQHDLCTVPLFGTMRQPKPDPVQAPQPTPPTSPPALTAAFYGASQISFLVGLDSHPFTPPNKADIDHFLQDYIWVRLRMGQKHPDPANDPSGLRCAAGRSFCRECYQNLTDCEESSNSRRYWRLYAFKEPAYWRHAAQRIINSRRSTRSPLYEPCSDDWTEVLLDAWKTLNPGIPLATDTYRDPPQDPDSDDDSEYQSARSTVSDDDDDISDTADPVIADSASVRSSGWSDPVSEAADYDSDPDWAWLTQNGYVSDTSENYDKLRPKKLLKRKPVLDDCGLDSTPWRDGSSEDTPPLFGLSLDSPKSTASSPVISSPEPIHPDQFWDTVTKLPQFVDAFGSTSSGKPLPWATLPLPSPAPAKKSLAYEPVFGWGSEPSPWDQPRCSCTGWCSCEPLTGF